MGPNGESPVRLDGPLPGEDVWNAAWSPDGRWLTYIRRADQSGRTFLEARHGESGTVTTVLSDPDVRGFCWLSPRQVVLDRWEEPARPFSNLWRIDVDPKTLKAVGEPQRLTNWAGFAIGGMSASTEGKRVALIKRFDQSDVMLGELASRTSGLVNIRPLTTDERVDWPGDWSADSKRLLFQSDRTGRMGIFRQQIDAPNPETIVADARDNRGGVLSPDRKWVLYLSWPHSVAQPVSGRLMRIPMDGGSPETILEAKGSPGSAQTSARVIVPTAAGHPVFRCARLPGAPCVLSEAGPAEVVFYSFAPVPGTVKSELLRLAVQNASDVSWDLSPDGSRIAYSEKNLRTASVHIYDLQRRTTRDINLAGWAELTTVSWAANAKTLFVTIFDLRGSSLLQVSFDGSVRTLYKAAKEAELPRASPDGRYLAFGEVVSGSNVWLIEKIPN